MARARRGGPMVNFPRDSAQKGEGWRCGTVCPRSRRRLFSAEMVTKRRAVRRVVLSLSPWSNLPTTHPPPTYQYLCGPLPVLDDGLARRRLAQRRSKPAMAHYSAGPWPPCAGWPYGSGAAEKAGQTGIDAPSTHSRPHYLQ